MKSLLKLFLLLTIFISQSSEGSELVPAGRSVLNLLTNCSNHGITSLKNNIDNKKLLQVIRVPKAPSALNPIKAWKSMILLLQPKSQALLVALQNKIVELERQTILYREEIRQIRTLLRKQQRENRSKDIESFKDSVSNEKKLREEIEILNKQLEDVESTKNKVKQLMKDEKKKLQNEIEEQRKEMKILKKRIEELQDLQKDTLDLLCQERDYYQSKLKDEHKKLNDEKQRAQEAIEKERSKMRKLVKALALKEKSTESSSVTKKGSDSTQKSPT
mmetsp:Transcript_17985/g.22016  ORF Transcript_17985/g.22016 Transcript_17985/m.22016 type:complete len:275 (-) Transcript_17985:12-836(-)